MGALYAVPTDFFNLKESEITTDVINQIKVNNSRVDRVDPTWDFGSTAIPVQLPLAGDSRFLEDQPWRKNFRPHVVYTGTDSLYLYYSTPTQHFDISVNPLNRLELIFTPKASAMHWYGTETLIIGVAQVNRDPNRVLATAVVTITVDPVDDPIILTCPVEFQEIDPDGTTVYVIPMNEDEVLTVNFTDYNGVRLIQSVDNLTNPNDFQFFITPILPPPYLINFFQTPLYTGKTVTFTPIPNYYGDYRFVVTNLDNNVNNYLTDNPVFNTCRNTFVIRVANINDAPVINSYLPASLNLELTQGDTQNFSVNATDADDPYSTTGTTMTYTWTVTGSNYGTQISQQISTTSSANYTFDYPGTFEVSVVVSDGIVTLDPLVWTVEVLPNGVIFSLLGGVYTHGVEVSLSTPAPYPNAPIYYTLDGSTPDANSPVYDPANPIVIGMMNTDNIVTITAMFIDDVYGPSTVLSQTYHITGDVGTPVFNLTPYDAGLNTYIYTTEQDLTISSSTPGAEIYYTYTTDGNPPADPATSGTLYTAPIHIGEDTRLKVRAIAKKNLWNNSAYAENMFRVTGTTRIDLYTFVPPPGTYIVPVDSVFMVTVTGIQLYPNDANTVLRYAINGTPTANSPIYTGQPIAIDEPSFIRIRAFRTDWAPSVYAEGIYIINNRVIIQAPVFSPAPGQTYTAPINVSINSTIPSNGRVYFTISYDGTEPPDPNENSIPYISNNQILVDSFETAIIKARAYHDDVLPSPVYRAGYTVSGPVDNPMFVPAPGAYETTQHVLLSTVATNTQIYYTYSNDVTVEPADPNNTGVGTLYTGAITAPEGTTIIKARAYKNNWAPSGISRGVYYVNILAPPSFVTDNAVIYTSPVNVVLQTDPLNRICYTTDGSDPMAIGENITNGILYVGPITVPVQTIRTIKARAIRDGWNQSAIATRTYTVTDQVATPTFTVNLPNTYLNPTQVGLSCATSDITIYYTTDGSAPSINSTQYTGPFFVNVTRTIRAIAVKADWATSDILTGVYNISGTVAMPAFTPPPTTSPNTPPTAPYTNAIDVWMYSATPGAIIRYTTDGSVPTATHGTTFDISSPVPVSASLTINAIAYVVGGNSSAMAIGNYVITGTVETPVFSLNSGAYAGTQYITISSTTPGATIYYTTDGTVPNAGSNVYTGQITVTQSTTFKAIAILNGWANSGIGVASYIINSTPISLVFSPLPGSHYEELELRIISYPSDATVNYTLDGSVPNQTSLVYDNQNPPQITQTTTVKAIAYHNEWPTPVVKTGQYNFFVRTPSLSHSTGVYAQGFNLVLTPNTTGSEVYYTLDGSDPTTSATRIQYTAPITILQTTVLRAYGARNNWTNSPEIAATFTINGAVSMPVFSIQGGTYNAPITLGISALPADATVRYTTDGSVPTATYGTIYSGPFSVPENSVVQAIAYKEFWITSSVATASYKFRPVAPIFTLIESLADHKTISLSTSPINQTYIRYTTDGITPPSRTTGTLYEGPFSINGNTNIKAIAYRDASIAWDVSLISEAGYTMKVTAPVFSPVSGVYSQAQTVQFTNTDYDHIYYTLNGPDPTAASIEYTGAFVINTGTIVKAIAVKNNWIDSDITTATYTFQLPAPTFSSVTGTYPNAINLTMATIAGAEIRYTLDGSEPTSTSLLYTPIVSINSYTVVKAKSFLVGWNPSETTTSTYSFQVGTPFFTPVSGAYTSTQYVQIESATLGAEIRYTTDGVTVPTATSPLYSAPITVLEHTSVLIKAKAFKTDWVTSNEALGAYSITGPVLVTGGVNGSNAFTPAPGVYTVAQNVSISGSFDTLPGDVIRFTLDGSEPDANSLIFPGILNLPDGVLSTIKIKVFRTGWAPSTTITGVYNITGQVVISNNIFTPIGGTYQTAQAVSLNQVTTPVGATLRYTMDGTDPTNASPEYVSPLIIPAGVITTVKVRGFKQDWIPSAIETAVYTISPQVVFVDPIFTPASGMDAVSVSIGTTLPANAIIYYTLDGSTPTEASAVYSAPILIPVGIATIIKARAFAVNYSPSNVVVAAYNANILPTPVFTPAAGTYSTVQNISISVAIPSSTIYYTLDGTDPTTASTLYTAPVALQLNQIYNFRAKAYKTGYFESPVAVATYNMTGVVADVAFSIPGGTYSGAQSVALSTTTVDAIIRYTLDGTEPTATSTRYYTPIDVPAMTTTTIKAKAFKFGWTPSNTVTHVYNINGAVSLSATFNWAPGIYQTARNIVITPTVLPTDAIVRYTTDGTDPTETSAVYSAPISLGLNSSTMIKVKAFKTDWLPSNTISAFYQITGQVAMSTPMFSPVSGTYQTQQFVTLNQVTTPAGATLYYTLDGSIPTLASQAYSPSNPIAVLLNSAATINVIAFLDNWIASDMMSASYNITGAVTLAAPLLSPAPGTYSTHQNITINGATPSDAVIRYTLDGTDPTAASPVYTTAISLPMAQVTTIKVRAFKNTWASSAIVTGVYNMTGQVAVIQPVFDPAPGYYSTPQLVSIVATTIPSNAVIRYTTNGDNPTSTSPQYAGPISIPGDTQVLIKARAFFTDWIASEVYTGLYNVTGVVNPVVFNPIGGTYQNAQNVVLTTPTPYSSIYYTVDGSNPSQASSLYTTAINVPVNTSMTIKAKAYRSGWTESTISQQTYNITGQVTLSMPVFSVASGTYQTAQTVEVLSVPSPSDAVIRYTTDGSVPTETSTIYSAALTIPLNTVRQIKVRAFRAGWLPSDIYTADYVVTGQITLSAAMFTPTPGVYTTSQTVTLNTATIPAGATLRYTLNGSDPDENSASYFSPIVLALNSVTTIKVKAFKADWTASDIVSGIYTITGQVSFTSPVFTPASGNYSSTQTVSISSPIPADATVRYTTDSSDPSETVGTIYSAPLTVSVGQTIKAIAYKANWVSSSIAMATYQFDVSAPSFTPLSGSYPDAQTITLTTPTNGASIRYTLDGSDPTDVFGMLYTAPFTVSQSTIVKAIAYMTGWNSSPVVSSVYAINGAVANPIFNPIAGTYNTDQLVGITSFPGDASIRYTTNGTDPTPTTGTLYTVPVAITANTTLKAIAFKTDWINSEVATAVYNLQVLNPMFSIVSGIYTSGQSLTLNVSTPGAQIRYTTNGTNPSPTDGTLYTAPITINSSQTVKAIAYKTGWLSSAIIMESYEITGVVADVVFNPLGGTFQNVQSVNLSTTTAGTTIRYTTDGSNPTDASPAYSSAIIVPLNTSMTIKAIAYKAGWVTSGITQQTYNVTGTVEFPATVFSPTPGVYTTAQNITIAFPTPQDANVRYTLDGTEPTTTSQLYTGPISLALNTNMTVKVKAFKTDWTPSLTYTGIYTTTGTVQMSAPYFSPAAGLYTSAQTVSINSTTVPTGAVIHYTMDGSDPNNTSPIYTTPISIGVNTSVVIRARAYLNNWLPSTIHTAAYTVTGQVSIADPVFTPAAGLYQAAQFVTLNTTTQPAGSQLRYTTDGTDPTASSALYTSAIELAINTQTSIKVRAFKTDWIPSPVYTADYTITGQVSWTGNQFTPAAGIYTVAQSVAISAAPFPSASTVHYTTDGSEPDETSAIYTAPIEIPLNTASMVIKAKAFSANWIPSETISATYSVTGQVTLQINPFNVLPGIYTTAQTVQIAPATLPTNAVIRYTIDGTDPTVQSLSYTDPLVFALDTITTLKIKGFAENWVASDVQTAVYTITGTVADPTLSHADGIYSESFELLIQTTTLGATIRYTLDGSDPLETSPIYTEGIEIPELIYDYTVKAKAFKQDWVSSGIVTGTYSVLLLPINVRAFTYSGYIRVIWNSPIATRTLDSFNVYRRRIGETQFVKMNTSPIVATQDSLYYYDDYAILNNQSYQYYVTAIYNGIESNPSMTTTIEYQSQDLTISDVSHVYPNPAITSCKIKLVLSRNDNVQISVSIYDFAGKKVQTLTVPTTSANLIEIPWDLKTSGGVKVARGTYFARIVANDGINRSEKVIKIAVK
jgi:hypothetical protein